MLELLYSISYVQLKLVISTGLHHFYASYHFYNVYLCVFGVLPKPRNACISPPALSLLRSSLIELVLQQINLTLTPSIFGETLCFEVLKFPGGITVIPLQTSSIWERTKALFNFTVSNSINHIQDNMKKLKDQLKVGGIVYVQMTNVNGSAIAPPVTLQASILSDNESGTLLPNRLKQLAVTGSHAQNLGLNHSVYGEVKSIVLTSYLKNSVSSLQASSPSPYPSPSPSPSPPIATPYSSPFEECSLSYRVSFPLLCSYRSR
ncbi:uncharacterized protein LOC110099763 [Dendrobium catenatum]|uniref:uncharacterized protein LOC110099763 n=1 Tax=Dendrobium catenatum TaxID=906689 RepID=UPI0009F5B1D6|nr:uncharacterized protein LOC110099763 [Dendrobium catenatum]